MNKIYLFLVSIILLQSTYQQHDLDGQQIEGPFDASGYDQQVLEEQQQQQFVEAEQDGEEAEMHMQIMRDWEKHMSDFVPDEMLTFTVQSSEVSNFFEDVHMPTNIRGAYFVSFYSQEILNPRGKVIFKRTKQKEAIFHIDVDEYGTYTFEFDNSQGSESKDITFAIDLKNRTDDHLSGAHLDPIEESLMGVHTDLSVIFRIINNDNLQGYSNGNKKTHGRLLIMSVFETIAILAATIWQTYYIKKILDNRRIV